MAPWLKIKSSIVRTNRCTGVIYELDSYEYEDKSRNLKVRIVDIVEYMEHLRIEQETGKGQKVKRGLIAEETIKLKIKPEQIDAIMGALWSKVRASEEGVDVVKLLEQLSMEPQKTLHEQEQESLQESVAPKGIKELSRRKILVQGGMVPESSGLGVKEKEQQPLPETWVHITDTSGTAIMVKSSCIESVRIEHEKGSVIGMTKIGLTGGGSYLQQRIEAFSVAQQKQYSWTQCEQILQEVLQNQIYKVDPKGFGLQQHYGIVDWSHQSMQRQIEALVTSMEGSMSVGEQNGISQEQLNMYDVSSKKDDISVQMYDIKDDISVQMYDIAEKIKDKKMQNLFDPIEKKMGCQKRHQK